MHVMRGEIAHRKGSAPCRLRDAYKEVHTAGEPWLYCHRVRNSKIQERRYDVFYVSSDFAVVACRYRSDWLGSDLSDHAAVEADLVLHA